MSGTEAAKNAFAIGRCSTMRDKDKTLDLSSKRQPQSKLNRRRAWAQLKAKYLKDLQQQLDGITTILEIKDYNAIKKHAHRIKGTSGTYRLDTISKSVARLEQLADNRNPDAIVTTINEVKRLVELETSRLDSTAISSIDGPERVANG